MIQITLEGEFTTLNEYIAAERTHRHKAAEIKKYETQRVRIETIGTLPIPPEFYPMRVTFSWYCKNTRTDPDNIAFAKKFIMDGLQESGVIRGDGWKEVAEFHDRFHVNSDTPYVVVIFEGPKGE